MLDTARTILLDGGWVMYCLLAVSLVTGVLVLERLIYWGGIGSRRGRAAIRKAADLVRAKDFAGAKQAVAGSRDTSCAFAAALLAETRALGGAGATEGAAHDLLEYIRPQIERSMSTLSAIITAAPMLGILGTVVGIINSFRLLDSDVTIDDPSAVAGGIATALYTTAFGLMIALGALVPYVHLRGRVHRLLGRLEAFSALVIERDEA